MKKLLIAAFMMLGFAGVNAQPAVKAAPAKESKMKAVKKDAPAAKVVKMEKAKPAVTTAPGTKADGTPDMRFKANKGKAAKAPTGPTKKDGTLDKRFKANKKTN